MLFVYWEWGRKAGHARAVLDLFIQRPHTHQSYIIE